MKLSKNTKVSVVKGFEREKFEKWCLEQNKNPKNDISLVEYLAKVVGDKTAKLFMENLEKGEVTAENLEVHYLNENVDSADDEDDEEEDEFYTEEELDEKFDAYCELVKSIAIISGVEKDKYDNYISELKKLSSSNKYAYVESTIGMFGEEFCKIIRVGMKWLEMAQLFDSLTRGDK